MIVRFGFAPRRPGLPITEFQAHWAGRHGMLASQLAGVGRYWQNHAILENDEPLLPWAGFDACAEIAFDSVAAMHAAFDTDHYRVAVRADEDYLVDKRNGGMVTCRRLAGQPPPANRGVRLLSFLRAAPGGDRAALAAALTTGPSESEATAREIFLALDPADAEGHVSPYDAVEILWFEDAAAARAHVVSAAARGERAALGGLVRGVDRLIAKVVVIV